MFGMANLRPEETGIPIRLHAYKNTEERAQHGPRVKAYPGKFHEKHWTSIMIPEAPNETASVHGKLTLSNRDLRLVLEFIDRNWRFFILYWYVPDYTEIDLRNDLRDAEGLR